jgi:hypothetical protein
MVKLKYKLNDLVNELPRNIGIAELIDELNKHGINRDAFYRDRKITINSNHSIPSDRLDVYAIIFGCTTDELKNYKVKGRSIRDIVGKKIKTGLR